MKKLFTVFAVTLVAAVWMTGSWLFFNSIAAGAQGSATAAVADADKAAPKDEAPLKDIAGNGRVITGISVVIMGISLSGRCSDES